MDWQTGALEAKLVDPADAEADAANAAVVVNLPQDACADDPVDDPAEVPATADEAPAALIDGRTAEPAEMPAERRVSISARDAPANPRDPAQVRSRLTLREAESLDAAVQDLAAAIDALPTCHGVAADTVCEPLDKANALLEHLEDISHQVDHGIDLAKSESAIPTLLAVMRGRDTPEHLRYLAASVLGSALANNHDAQLLAARFDLVPKLWSLVASARSETLQSRFLFTLASLVRSNPSATASLVWLDPASGDDPFGGIVRLISSGPWSIRLRALHLVADLVDRDMVAQMDTLDTLAMPDSHQAAAANNATSDSSAASAQTVPAAVRRLLSDASLASELCSVCIRYAPSPPTYDDDEGFCATDIVSAEWRFFDAAGSTLNLLKANGLCLQ
nr:hypothetical protein HK105_002323 [Polyrhizophydium stewartii]